MLAPFLPFLFLLSAVVIGWYRLKFKPRKAIRALIKEGAKVPTLEKDRYDSLSFLKRGIQKDPNVKAYVISLPGHVGLFFIDTELIKEVLSNQKNYSKLSATSELSVLINARGITKAEGDVWKLHRKIVSEAFQYDLFNGMIPTIIECVNDVINLSDKKKRTVRMPQDIELITSDAVTRIFFGVRSKDVYINGKPASVEATEIIRKSMEYGNSSLRFILGNWVLNIFTDYREQKKRIQHFRSVFAKKIHERMNQIKSSGQQEDNHRKDLLEILLQHRIKHNNDPSQTLSDDEILDEFSVFFLAGKDTTSLLISMALYCYVEFPEWAEKLQAEVDEKFKDTKDINVDLVNSLNMMSAFLNEVLRLYPPAPALLRRVANQDHKVGNFSVKKGFIINTMFISNHYNPKFFDHPFDFDPGRWLKTENKDEGVKNPFAYLPFSAGQRNCVGKHLALIEAKIVIGLILKNFKLNVHKDYILRLGNQSIGYGPVDPIPLILTPRE